MVSVRDVAARGPWVSAHPDTILTMGTKEILFRTKHIGWGTDTHLYRTATAFKSEFPARLTNAGPRVIKDTTQAELPPGFQTAEFLLDHGLIDAIVPRKELKTALCSYLEAIMSSYRRQQAA